MPTWRPGKFVSRRESSRCVWSGHREPLGRTAGWIWTGCEQDAPTQIPCCACSPEYMMSLWRRVHVNSVAIDEVEVPQFVLELFVDKYVTPRYPGVGLDSVFALPDKIETATVGEHRLTIVQR